MTTTETPNASNQVDERHEYVPAPGSICTRLGRQVEAGAQPDEYPLTGICRVSGERIALMDGTAEWALASEQDDHRFPVLTDSYEPDRTPGRAGYLHYLGQRNANDVYRDLKAAVGLGAHFTGRYASDNVAIWETTYSVPGCDEYFHAPDMELWPKGRNVVYAVTGGSEGHYVCVSVIDDAGKHTTVVLGKTFDGFDAAWGFALKLAKLLEV